MLKGIDVSKHNGSINWETVKEHIDFAMLRAGYGTVVDSKFHYNASKCNELNIPIGIYWFSYARSVNQALEEAKTCIKTIAQHKIDYPVCYDFEYDSINNARKKGVVVTRMLMIEMAKSFLFQIEKAGYYAMNYTNIDFLNRGFSEITNRFDTWLAQWGKSSPTKSCGIWQYSSTGSVPGISGHVDLNYAMKSYGRASSKATLSESDKANVLKLPDSWWATYLGIAHGVIRGMYGEGEERKKLIKAAGFDYTIVQKIVNILLEK